MLRQRKERNVFVNADTGLHSKLKGESLVDAIKDGKVIARTTFYNRELVDAKTGKRTSLAGDKLFKAIECRTVLPRHVFMADRLNRVRLKYVDAKTGNCTDYTDLELAEAGERGEVIPRVDYEQRIKEAQDKRPRPQERLLCPGETDKRQKTAGNYILPRDSMNTSFVLTSQGLCRKPFMPLLSPCMLPDTGLKEMTSWIRKNMPEVTPVGLSQKAALPEKIALPEKVELPKKVGSNSPDPVRGSFLLANGVVFYAPKSPKPTGGSSPNSPTDENNASLANVRQARL